MSIVQTVGAEPSTATLIACFFITCLFSAIGGVALRIAVSDRPIGIRKAIIGRAFVVCLLLGNLPIFIYGKAPIAVATTVHLMGCSLLLIPGIALLRSAGTGAQKQ